MPKNRKDNLARPLIALVGCILLLMPPVRGATVTALDRASDWVARRFVQNTLDSIEKSEN